MHVYRRIAPMLYALVLLAALSTPLLAQTVDDGIMLARHELLTGNVYSYESWDQYWEGPLKRTNGNIGEITTETNVWYANYGVTNRLNVLGTVPFVWTHASQGVLHGSKGFQDITLAAKYQLLEKASPRFGSFRTIAVMSAAIPLTHYNPELPPLSIGSGSTRLSGRVTANVQSSPGWFVNGSGAYTWRSEVTLDRPYYYTDDQFVMSDKVDMPNAFDYIVSAGYMKRRLMAEGFLSQQRTLGGGDIRRQDMPFVSNRMNFSRVGAMVMHAIPKLTSLEVQLAYAYTLDGRNVGQASTVTAGILYRFGSPAQ
jgi:hypothetical protein